MCVHDVLVVVVVVVMVVVVVVELCGRGCCGWQCYYGWCACLVVARGGGGLVLVASVVSG